MESTAWAERPHVAAKGEGGGERERCGGLIYRLQYGGVGGSVVEDLKKEGISVQLQVESEKKGENGHTTLQYEMRMISEVVEEE